MLVLSRKTQEKICIGDNITLTILQIKGKTVRVGIEAPRDVRVIRGELPRHDSPVGMEPGIEAATAETHPPRAVAGRIDRPTQPPAGTNRLRDLVFKVTSNSAAASNAI